MKFKDYPYKRPDMDAFKSEFNQHLEAFKSADSAEAQIAEIKAMDALKTNVATMFQLAGIRYSINTNDAFYDAENAFADENGPILEGVQSNYYRALLDTKFKAELLEVYGEHIFNLAEVSLKTFSDEVLPLMQRENKLSSEYRKLRASAKINYDGKVLNLPQMESYMQSKDRAVRQSSAEAFWQFFADNLDEFDRIYDELVKVRHEIAQKLGFKNFVELGYAKLNRTDYTAKEVAGYREQVRRDLVPYVRALGERKQKRLGLDKLYYYDGSISFNSGNATPKGDAEFMVERAKAMYHDMSPETGEFIDFMLERDLLDLLAKEGKAGGGFCEFLGSFASPFIFANFNGTSGDVDVLTHEAGHAFQVYQSRNVKLSEYVWPTFEAAEIHSMSMEFFAWPYMADFFKEDVEKYKFMHLADAVEFLPYGVTVDEFQHFVYEHPEATPAERHAKWREIEKKYSPEKDYDGNEILEKGAFWVKQGHIFEVPFYYIDYTLAQICALQFWHKSRVDKQTAWADYLRLCKRGGEVPFTSLVDVANLNNPFIDGTIKATLEPVKAYLDSVDDMNL